MAFVSKKKKEILGDFVKKVIDELKIKTMPRIFILNGRGELKTTASYDYTNDVKVIKINGKGRAIVDILRSIAHELTHHKQYEEGRITDSKKDGADGSDIENEANAKAGYFIRKYCKTNPIIYDLDEQEETPTTSTTGGSTAYPEVGHWESGATRGAGNSIGNTKWADVVGSKLTRGKANPIR